MKIPALGVIVLDAAGHAVAYKREDGASMFREDIAQGKAWGAVAMGCSSRALAKRAQSNPNFITTLAATAQGRFLPQMGGVLIRDAAARSSERPVRAEPRETRTRPAACTASSRRD
jgi:uncharacterized protein GlcG (DUF336 family)